MNIEKYIPRSEDVVLLSQADQVRTAQVLLEAAYKKRDELRLKNENSPKHCPERLTDDMTYVAGMIGGLNWVLNLIPNCNKYINQIDNRAT